MATLYPPYIEGNLPAQTGDTIRIPFEHNRAVGKDDYTGFRLLIKTIATDKQIAVLDAYATDTYKNEKYVEFKLDSALQKKLKKGLYYKAQLAYRDGIYSFSGSGESVEKHSAREVEKIEDYYKVYAANGSATINIRLAKNLLGITNNIIPNKNFDISAIMWTDANLSSMQPRIYGVKKGSHESPVPSGRLLTEEKINYTISYNFYEGLDNLSFGVYNSSGFNSDDYFYFQNLLLTQKDDSNFGIYSTTGVFKYLEKTPFARVYGEWPNFHGTLEFGEGWPAKNKAEKISKYKFTLIIDGNQEYTTGWKIHDLNDGNKDYYYCNFILKEDQHNQLIYEIETISGLKLQGYKGGQKLGGVKEYECTDILNEKVIIEFNNNFEEGYSLIKLTPKSNKFIPYSAIYCRKSKDKKWYKISGPLINNSYNNFLIESGEKYKYGFLKEEDSTIQMASGYDVYDIKADYEHMFLYDGERQLKIKFNPKVSSFKTTVLESKQDTLGGKYPFFFRNGNTEYKEFSISGLISYLSDDQKLFTTLENSSNNEHVRTKTKSEETVDDFSSSTDLTSDNVYAERKFREQVLDWLNNGQVKIFKSPTEGMIMVRLMNVSLTPNDQLGRMLYTFNCTAYEVAPINTESLIKYGFMEE